MVLTLGTLHLKPVLTLILALMLAAVLARWNHRHLSSQTEHPQLNSKRLGRGGGGGGRTREREKEKEGEREKERERESNMTKNTCDFTNMPTTSTLPPLYYATTHQAHQDQRILHSSAFCILHSAFCILHSAFCILHSALL
jgi:hypothetical protein